MRLRHCRTASTTPRLRHFFRTIDQVCIFLLIAGTFTPHLADLFACRLVVGAVYFMWALALAGICCKMFFTRLHNVSVVGLCAVGLDANRGNQADRRD